MPLCINYRTKELQYQNEISQILESNLTAIMPTFNRSRVDPQPHGRYKRFVSTLTRILCGGLNAFINHKKHSALQKGIAQTTLKEIGRL